MRHGDRSLRHDARPGCPLAGEPVPLHQNGPHIDQAALWADLRDRFGTVAPVEIRPGTAAWLLLGYHESLQVLRDTEHFSSDPGNWREVREGRVSLEQCSSISRGRPLAIPEEGGRHRRLRTPIAHSLARVGEGRLCAEVQSLADGLIDTFVAEGRVDLIGRYARLLPIMLLNRLFGLDEECGSLLRDLVVHVDEEPSADARIRDFCTVLVEHKRVRPGADLPSWLIEHPAGLTDEEVATQLHLLIHAGTTPTTHLIGNTVRRFLVEPRLAATFSSGSMSPGDVLDYVMWTDPPLRVLPARYPTCDMRLGNAWIREGEALLIGIASAHDDPGTGNSGGAAATRNNRAHLMWGVGSHGCPAQSFARDMAGIAVTSVLERLAGLRLDGSADTRVRWCDPVFVQGLAELPVAFLPAAPRRSPVPRPAVEPAGTLERRLVRVPAPSKAKGARYHKDVPAADSSAPTTETLSVSVPAPKKKRKERAHSVGARYHVPR